MDLAGLTGPSPAQTCIATVYVGLNIASGLRITYTPTAGTTPSDSKGHLVICSQDEWHGARRASPRQDWLVASTWLGETIQTPTE